jgi:hypothetical protein
MVRDKMLGVAPVVEEASVFERSNGAFDGICTKGNRQQTVP